jgi:hypothetical protein
VIRLRRQEWIVPPIVSHNQTEPESQKRPFAFQIEKS